MKKTLKFAAVLLAAAASTAFAAEPSASSKPIRLVTALPAGADTYVRLLAQRLTELMGQSAVVENRPGGAWVPAARMVITSPPDGHTLLVYSVVILISKNLQPSLNYDPVGDFTPIAKIYGDGGALLVVSPDGPFRTLQDLVAFAKSAPGKAMHGGSHGTSSHLGAASFLAAAGAKGYHVPFKGPGDDFAAIQRGDIHFSVTAATVSLPQVTAGKLRALAVTSGNRIRNIPDVPTLREALNNEMLVQDNWTGLAGPLKMPAAMVTRLHAETQKVLNDAAMRKVIDAGGNTPSIGETTDQFGAFIRRENEKWREIVKVSGLKIE